MKFADIEGNPIAVEAMRKMVDTQRVPHSILISGPAGIGKMRLARAFVQYLHCANPRNGDSCGECSSCRQHQNFNNPDIHFHYPAVKDKSSEVLSADFAEQWRMMLTDHSFMEWEEWLTAVNAGTKQPIIYVSQAQEISDKAIMSPTQESKKVFLIWLPEKMQLAAANKLLKLIEEPYDDTIFLLVSNRPKDILPTIFSRVQRISMRPLPVSEITKALQVRGISPDTAHTAAQLSEGSLGLAISIASCKDEAREFGAMFREIMRCAYARKIARLRQLCEDCAEMGREKERRFLEYGSRMVRENFIYNFQIPDLSLLTDEEAEFSFRFAPFIHQNNVEDMLRQFSTAERDISRNANAKIVFFSLFMHLCMLIRTKKPT